MIPPQNAKGFLYLSGADDCFGGDKLNMYSVPISMLKTLKPFPFLEAFLADHCFSFVVRSSRNIIFAVELENKKSFHHLTGGRGDFFAENLQLDSN